MGHFDILTVLSKAWRLQICSLDLLEYRWSSLATIMVKMAYLSYDISSHTIIQPIIIISYGHEMFLFLGTKGYLTCHIEDWRIEGLTFIPNILETASILHVTLLVFLRLLAVTDPMKYKEAHVKSRHKSIIVIWLTSVIVRLTALLSQKYHSTVFFYYRYFLLHIFHTVPIITIVIMYVRLIMILKRRSTTLTAMTERSQQLSESINRKMAIVVKRIVVSLLICYVPFLSWEQYYMVIAERVPFIIYKNEVIIT